ncbi:MAG: hypothetical protein ACR2M1_02000 [Gemmatimonadaceae bacterium]
MNTVMANQADRTWLPQLLDNPATICNHDTNHSRNHFHNYFDAFSDFGNKMAERERTTGKEIF